VGYRNVGFSPHDARVQVCPARPDTKELAPDRLRSLMTQSARLLRSGLADVETNADGGGSSALPTASGAHAPSTKAEQSRCCFPSHPGAYFP
jgi:hypothetical protein